MNLAYDSMDRICRKVSAPISVVDSSLRMRIIIHLMSL